VDGNTLSRLPGEMNQMNMLDFCRHLGADIFLLDGWGTQHAFRSPELRWPGFIKQTESTDPRNSDILVRKWTAPKGELVGIFNRGHPVKYSVDSIHAIRLYREMWEGATYLAHDDSKTLMALEALVGNDGVVTRFWGPSAIPRLLEMDMGAENFYLFCFDHPGEMDELVRVMHERELRAFEHIANGPWTSATLIENTSTFYVSPEIYRKYNMPHQRNFVHALHRTGMTAILHMCGHVHGILEMIKETGCDGIHALTPPPTGDTPWEDALDVMGQDLVIICCLDPTVWISGKIEEIGPTLDRMITPRIREANFVLGTFADGIPVALDRFEAIKRWMQKNVT
jgi:hypothetical protein